MRLLCLLDYLEDRGLDPQHQTHELLSRLAGYFVYVSESSSAGIVGIRFYPPAPNASSRLLTSSPTARNAIWYYWIDVHCLGEQGCVSRGGGEGPGGTLDI